MKRFSLVFLIVVFTFTMALSARTSAAEYELTAYQILDEESVLTQATIKWAEMVEERTDGAVVIDVFHSGELGGDVETIDEMRQGLIDIRTAGGGLYSHFYPKVLNTELPFLFQSPEHVQAVLNGPLGEELNKGFEDYNIKVLAWFDIGFRGISNSVRPVHSVEDVEGLSIRVPEADHYVLTWEEFGANPTAMAWPDVYMSLQTGVLDAQDNAPEHTWTNNTYEVQDYYTWTKYIWMGGPLAINLDTWNELPEEYQKVMEEAGHEASAWSFEELEEAQMRSLENMDEAGLEINYDPDIDSFEEATNPLYEEILPELDWYDEEWVEEVRELGEELN